MPLSAKRVSILSAAALVGSLMLSASPGSADPDDRTGTSNGDKPTISEVKDRVDALNHQAEIASENLNTVRVEMQAARKRLSALQADVDRKRAAVEKLRSLVVGTALSDYQKGGGLSTTTSFLVADDPGAFMNGVASKAMVEHQQTALLTTLTQRQTSPSTRPSSTTAPSRLRTFSTASRRPSGPGCSGSRPRPTRPTTRPRGARRGCQ
jgi:hypothetical protein